MSQTDNPNNVLNFLGGLTNAFAEIRIAETNAELERLRFDERTVTNRPEQAIDESAAAQRNAFGLTPDQTTMVTSNQFVGGAMILGGVLLLALLLRS